MNFSPSSLQLICGALLRKSPRVVLCSSPPMCCLMRTWSWCLGRLQGSRCNLHLHWGGCVESCTTHFTLYYGPPEHTQSLLNYLHAIHLWWQTCRNCAPFLRQPSLISEQPEEPPKEKRRELAHYTTFIWPLFINTFDCLLTKAAGITGNTSLAGNQIHFRSFKLQTVLGDNYI